MRRWQVAALLLALAAGSATMVCAWGADAGGCHLRVRAFALSPDGRHVAELWRSSVPRCPAGLPTSTAACAFRSAHAASVRGCPSERVVLGTIGILPVKVRTLLTGSGISQLRWVDGSRIAFVHGKGGRRLELADIRTKGVTDAVTAPGGIHSYVVSPTGRRVAYIYSVARPPLPPDWVSMRVPDGSGTASLIIPGMFHYTTQVVRTAWLVKHGHTGTVHTRPYKTHALIRQLAWLRRRGDTPRAVVLRDANLHDTEFKRSLIDLATGATIIGHESILRVAESPSGLLAVLSVGPPRAKVLGRMRLYVRDSRHRMHRVAVPAGGPTWGTHFWWRGNRLIWVEVANTDSPTRPVNLRQPFDRRLVEIDWRHDRVVRSIGWPNGNLADCQMNRGRSVAVCLAQTLTASAKLVRVDLRSGRMAVLKSLSNPTRRLGISFRDLRVRNKFGRWSTSFLAVPHGKTVSGKVPLAILMYDFGRAFAKGGQWIHAYPVARLVHSGIAVLLLNFPQALPLRTGDPQVARFDNLEDPLATLDNAPAAVRSAGVNVGKVVIMGWSWGGLIAAHAIENSCRFVAAQTGDPADWNITAYALGDAWSRYDMDDTLGGPPEGRSLGNYLAFDPMRSGLPPKGPIMLEYMVNNLPVGQYLAEWRAAGAYVEAFAYHHSVHWLNIPAEAKISQERNLAWAKLNLLGPRSVSPAALRRLDLTVPPPSAYRCR